MENTSRICKAPTAVCLPSRGQESCCYFLCPSLESQSRGLRVYLPCTSRRCNGFCKVFPVDLADGLCWHVAKSAQNIMIWVLFLFGLKKKFFFQPGAWGQEAGGGR